MIIVQTKALNCASGSFKSRIINRQYNQSDEGPIAKLDTRNYGEDWNCLFDVFH